MCAKTASKTLKNCFKSLFDWRPKAASCVQSGCRNYRLSDRQKLRARRGATRPIAAAYVSHKSAILDYEAVLSYTLLYASEQLTDLQTQSKFLGEICRTERQKVLHALLEASLYMGNAQGDQT